MDVWIDFSLCESSDQDLLNENTRAFHHACVQSYLTLKNRLYFRRPLFYVDLPDTVKFHSVNY
jgi:hypothetical protein